MEIDQGLELGVILLIVVSEIDTSCLVMGFKYRREEDSTSHSRLQVREEEEVQATGNLC